MILVSAAIIRNTAGEILICQRGAGGSCAFLWEFPGGKQEAGETAADCLVRECREELGIEIDIVALLEQTSYTYPDNKIGLSFFAAKITGGVPQKSVHQKILWVRPAELLQYQFCPADTEIVSRLAHWIYFQCLFIFLAAADKIAGKSESEANNIKVTIK